MATGSKNAKEGTRRVRAGDRAPVLTKQGIAQYEIAAATDGTRASKIAAVRDILSSATPDDMASVAQWLAAVMAGASPDDARSLRSALLQPDDSIFGVPPMHGGDELDPNCGAGGYPYLNLMQRKAYEEQKYLLQVELLKLQAWVKETGHKVVILFEGRDAAGKGARSSGSWKTSIHAAPESWHSTNLRRKKPVSGTFNATFNTCQRKVRSCCSIGRGTTVPESSE